MESKYYWWGRRMQVVFISSLIFLQWKWRLEINPLFSLRTPVTVQKQLQRKIESFVFSLHFSSLFSWRQIIHLQRKTQLNFWEKVERHQEFREFSSFSTDSDTWQQKVSLKCLWPRERVLKEPSCLESNWMDIFFQWLLSFESCRVHLTHHLFLFIPHVLCPVWMLSFVKVAWRLQFPLWFRFQFNSLTHAACDATTVPEKKEGRREEEEKLYTKREGSKQLRKEEGREKDIRNLKGSCLFGFFLPMTSLFPRTCEGRNWKERTEVKRKQHACMWSNPYVKCREHFWKEARICYPYFCVQLFLFFIPAFLLHFWDSCCITSTMCEREWMERTSFHFERTDDYSKQTRKRVTLLCPEHDVFLPGSF